MGKCQNCKTDSLVISNNLGYCTDCIRDRFEDILPRIREIHKKSRFRFNLPSEPIKDASGLESNTCVNKCRIPQGHKGYCGLRSNQAGRLIGANKNGANLDWYYDSLPTNCVADWVCAGGTGTGYPKFSYTSGPEYGFKNLAVFYNGCNFNCLFCQNWHYRENLDRLQALTPSNLASQVDAKTSCICYFGGDPTPQIQHSIEASRIALQQNKNRILRICWETNGGMNSGFLKQMVNISLGSGGCIKFDLKAWDEKLNIALCGVSNKQTLDNFKLVAQMTKRRSEPPLLCASTLLVPGYIDEDEVAYIARFIASLDADIPYSLLAFYPHFYMEDLPTTSRKHAQNALSRAKAEGLKNVRIGNLHLLTDAY